MGNGATDGTHSSSLQQNSNNEHTGHNNTGGHNSLAQSSASSHEGNLDLLTWNSFPNVYLWILVELKCQIYQWFVIQKLGHNGIGGTLSSSNLTSLGGCSPVPTPPSAHVGVSLQE